MIMVIQMSRLSKRDIKSQRDLMNLIATGLTNCDSWVRDERIDFIYENFHPSMIDNQTENGAFYTPYGLAQDVAVFSNRSGHIIDVCAGIGMLAYRLKEMDTYNKSIKSITCIELNEKAVEIGKKLLPDANWICANVFDENLWTDLTKDLPDNRYDFFVSNPPFGKDMNKRKADWLRMTSERDLMVLELCLKYSKGGYFIVPKGSYSYSGERYYKEEPDRWSSKFKRFMKITKDHYKFNLSCDGIDSSIYSEEWKGLKSMTVEAMDVQVWPYSLDYESDALSVRYGKYF